MVDHKKILEAQLSTLAESWEVMEGLGTLVRRHCKEDVRSILEWGPGTSSLLLENFAAFMGADKFISIEHEHEYLDQIAKVAKGMGSGVAPEFVVADLFERAPTKDRADYLFYSTAPLHFKSTFDLIFVDGRERSECLLTSALLSSKGGLVLIHDHHRLRYLLAKDLFEVVDEHCGVLALRRKALFDKAAEAFMKMLKNSDAPLEIHSPQVAPAPPKGEHILFSTEEMPCFNGLVDKFLPPFPVNVLDWGNSRSIWPFIQAFKKTHSRGESTGKFVPVRRFNASYAASQDIDHPFVETIAADLIGAFPPDRAGKELNYATAPLKTGLKFDLINVGGYRRNECLLTAAAILSDRGVVILRDYKAPYLTTGLSLYDIVAEEGNHAVLSLKLEFKGVFDKVLQKSSEAITAASITSPTL
jgi:hypothetical protein